MELWQEVICRIVFLFNVFDACYRQVKSGSVFWKFFQIFNLFLS